MDFLSNTYKLKRKVGLLKWNGGSNRDHIELIIDINIDINFIYYRHQSIGSTIFVN